jgi:predicted RNA-binding protein YlqC (UPF0109 family)
VPELRQQLWDVIELLLDHPDELDIDEIRRGRSGRLFEVRLAPEDAGKVIGRQGRTVRALRTLLEMRGDRDGVRYELEIVDD